MYSLIMFLKRHSIFLLFVVLQGLVIGYYLNSNSYTRAKAQMSAARVTGGTNKMFTSAGDYFTLRHDNDMLRQRIAELENKLAGHNPTDMAATDEADDVVGGADSSETSGTDDADGESRVSDASIANGSGGAGIPGGATGTEPTSSVAAPIAAINGASGTDGAFFYSPARVISNSTARQHNYFVIDRGSGSGVEEDMAVVSADGHVAGYVQLVSDNFAVCMSLLNVSFKIGGKIKGKDYFGSVFWDGVNPHFVTLSDIPRSAQVEVGDTVLSSYSRRFPQGTRIGVVDSFREAGGGTSLEIRVRLGMNMDKLSDVLFIKYRDSEELSGFAGEHFPDNN